MAERLKAVVLKTIVEFSLPGVRIPLSPLRSSQVRFVRGGARVDEWGRLLSGCTVEKPYRRFESCPLRLKNATYLGGVFCFA